MASTALKKDEIKELFDTKDKIETIVEKLAQLIKESKHAVIYTGAGLSTSAGIPDFRGPKGVWTLEAQGKEAEFLENFKLPTFSHMAIKKLVDENLVKFIVSQNVDGLHLKSGLPIEKLAELHGNLNKEYCKKCNKIFYRDFDACEDADDHRTSRKCLECNVYLYDSIIDFGENLPEEEFKKAEANSIECDLAIVLGSSLRVPPAAGLPMLKKKDGKLVICNLQKTPLDNKAHLLIHTKIDDLMQLLMARIGLETPDVMLHFSFDIICDKTAKTIHIENASVSMSSLFLSLFLIDVNEKCYKFTKKSLKVNCSKLNTSLDLRMGLEFNLLKSFVAFISLKDFDSLNGTSSISISLNANKNTFSYKFE
jgi:NAD-dependent SIR2 family protein deacetylase